MPTVTNNLTTHLVIPGATAAGKSLILKPKGTARVEVLTAPLRDAERDGHVAISDSGVVVPEAGDDDGRNADTSQTSGLNSIEPQGVVSPAVSKAPAARKKGAKRRQKRDRQILALAGEGKTQIDIAKALGTTRNVVQKALDKHRQNGAGNEE
jgi:hypothetical protein